MHTDIAERTEVCDIGDHTFKPASGDQILNRLNLVAELRIFEFLTRIAVRLFNFCDDVLQGVLSDLVIQELFCIHGLNHRDIAKKFCNA